MISVGYDPRAEREIQGLPGEIAERLHAAVLRLEADPLGGMPLHGKLAGYRSVRVGEYRASYRFHASERAVVHHVAHRREIHRER